MPSEKLPQIQVKGTKIHGKGVFAVDKIKKGEKIIEYVGEKITKKEAEKRIERIDKKFETSGIPPTYYIFELNKRYDIDGDVNYNTAKFINHSCDPNCETEDNNGRIWIIALRDIEKGEELSYDYEFKFDPASLPHTQCNCGKENCVGFIVHKKEWRKLRKYLENNE